MTWSGNRNRSSLLEFGRLDFVSPLPVDAWLDFIFPLPVDAWLYFISPLPVDAWLDFVSPLPAVEDEEAMLEETARAIVSRWLF